MEHVLLDRSSGSFEYRKIRNVYGGARPARPHGAYGSSRTCPQYHHFQKGGAWSSAPAPAPVLPYARPVIYSSPSLPLPPSNQPPLLPLPPTVTKYATFPYPPLPTPPPRTVRPAAPMTVVPAAAAPPASSRQLSQSDRRRRPTKPPATEPTRVQKKKKPLERATPLPPATVVAEALDDLEQEVARGFVQDLLHALAPPPSSLPLPRFSLVTKASSSSVSKVAPPAAPSCNAEAASADALRRLLRL
uniref:Uncharacterized protein n=1 Tax=Avena sativa TaxID=4498 RepID=A0ACD5WXX2_AVESA